MTLTVQEDADRSAYDEYIQCVIRRWWKTSFPGEEPPNCKLDSHPDLVFMDIQSACFASMGIVTFLVFGSPHAQNIYAKLMRCFGGSVTPKSSSRQRSYDGKSERVSSMRSGDGLSENLIDYYRNQGGSNRVSSGGHDEATTGDGYSHVASSHGTYATASSVEDSLA